MRKLLLATAILSLLSLTACTGKWVKPNADQGSLAQKTADFRGDGR